MRAQAEYEIAALITTVSETDNRVPIHNVPVERISAQARALGIPLWTVPLPQPCSNAEYAARLAPVWQRAHQEDIPVAIFGDLFLADIRAWRESLLWPTGVKPVFPLWQEPTRELARAMLNGGLAATVCAVDETKLSPDLIGHAFDQAFLDSLPPDVDPCGENGEFHTFVTRVPGYPPCDPPCAASSL